jgi:cell division protein ZapA
MLHAVRDTFERMAGRTVEVNVGGQVYRLVSSASEEEVQRLARIVDERLRALTPPGRPSAPQSLLLAAMALAHDAEVARRRAETVTERARGTLGKLLERVDAALDTVGPAASSTTSQPLE